MKRELSRKWLIVWGSFDFINISTRWKLLSDPLPLCSANLQERLQVRAVCFYYLWKLFSSYCIERVFHTGVYMSHHWFSAARHAAPFPSLKVRSTVCILKGASYLFLRLFSIMRVWAWKLVLHKLPPLRFSFPVFLKAQSSLVKDVTCTIHRLRSPSSGH